MQLSDKKVEYLCIYFIWNHFKHRYRIEACLFVQHKIEKEVEIRL